MTDISKDPVRLRNVTATEMSALLGVNPYSSPAKMLDNKLNPKPVVNNHVRRGKLMEPAVLEAFLLDLGMETDRHIGGTIELKEHRIAATPDAYTRKDGLVVEAKSIMSHTFEKWYTAIPMNYHIQVRVQMLVLDISSGYIGALEAGDPRECEHRFAAWEIKKNVELEEMMKSETVRLWKAVEEGKTFRVDSKIKKRVIELLEDSSLSTLIYPSKEYLDSLVVEKKDSADLSHIISLFK